MSAAMLTHQVVLHPAATASLKVLSTTVGRDKLYRAVQYFARFYAHWLASRGLASKETVARWLALKTALTQSRKLMRVGKWLEHLQSAVKAADNPDRIIKLTAIGRQLGYALYMFQDTLVWLHAVKVKTFSPTTYAKLQKNAARAWLAGICFSLLSGMYKRGKLQTSIKAAKSSSAATSAASPEKEVDRRTQLSTLKRQAYANNYQLTQDVLDCFLPAATLNYHSFSEGTLGLIGLVTSIMGLNAQAKSVLGSVQKA